MLDWLILRWRIEWLRELLSLSLVLVLLDSMRALLLDSTEKRTGEEFEGRSVPRSTRECEGPPPAALLLLDWRWAVGEDEGRKKKSSASATNPGRDVTPAFVGLSVLLC